jgi:short coiled-coil protein
MSSNPDMDELASSSGSQSPSEDDEHHEDKAPNPQVETLRPKLGSRKSSGTIIVPRDSPQIELKEENYDENDARTMSPRRSSEEIERMGTDARKALIE